MKVSTAYILAGTACILLLVAGCTSTPGTPEVTPTPTTTAPTPAIPATSWEGTWNGTWTEEGEEDSGIMFIQQDGFTVTGSYAVGNDTFDGTVEGNRLAGTWIETEDGEIWTGVFEFVMSDDQNSFTGKWAYTLEELETSSETWDGVRLRTVLPWTGRWDTTWTEEGESYPARLALLQAGSVVTGSYIESNGTIDGTIEGDTLTGTWSESYNGETSAGTFKFVLSSDWNSFTGKWASSFEELASADEIWDGVRVEP